MARYIWLSRFSEFHSVCDLGAGRCTFLSQAPHRIIGIDNSPQVVEHFRSQGFDIRLGDAYAIPLPDAHCHGVFCCWLLEHLESPERCVAEIFRILRPGGYACILVPSTKTLLHGFYDDFTHIRPFTLKSCQWMAAAAGFSTVRARYLWTRYVRLAEPFGELIYLRLARFADVYLRRFGLVNRRTILLEAWR
ncbi:MAG: class I SAM-dependent methyltransferase [Planctomycetota bacterium]